MNKTILDKIDTLIEETNQLPSKIISEYRPVSDTLTTLPIIGNIGNLSRGYTAGKKLDQPVVGTIFGPEGAAGAASINNSKIGIGDVYTKENILKRAGQGMIGGAAGVGAIHAWNKPDVSSDDKKILELIANEKGPDQEDALAYLKDMEIPWENMGGAALALGAANSLVLPGIRYGAGKLSGAIKNKLTNQKK